MYKGRERERSREEGQFCSSTRGTSADVHHTISRCIAHYGGYLVYKLMEAIIEKMQDENTGVPVKTVKSFMTKIPSVFTGTDLVAWLARHLNLEETWEALHVAHLLAAHGYLFPIDDHCLTVKNDNTYYRFQTPYFWPSNQWEPENTDYAVYLCKRTMQNKARLELADYEAESLARLQKMFSRKWEFIFMQAEAQSKVDKKRDKLERKVLDSQERAFWDVHRPMDIYVDLDLDFDFTGARVPLDEVGQLLEVLKIRNVQGLSQRIQEKGKVL
ncbi:hypothetical protein HF086_002784 [Spodoptera exigua]|uniref:DEP domain-containing protein n=1 Tax=Spodoptera exigua TaxID=7107 RepID=A0A922MNI9_SPOEX|nr:hypothetical protein HF086_002784 [Spodoptera exigua]